MSEFPSFETSSFPATTPEAPVKKTRGPRRGTTAAMDAADFSANGKGAAAPEPAKRKGRPPKEQRDTVVAPRTGNAYVIDLLPHLVGLQEVHVKPLTKLYHIIAEMHPSDRRRVASILARVFA